jgi:hypothetical protein
MGTSNRLASRTIESLSKVSRGAQSREGRAGAGTDQRVELIIGRSMEVDGNRHVLQGALVEETVAGWGHPMFRVTGGRQVVSTRMACPGQAPRRQLVGLGGRPTLVPVNPKLPIVVVAPKELEVRWRLWRPEPGCRRRHPSETVWALDSRIPPRSPDLAGRGSSAVSPPGSERRTIIR